MPDNNQ